MSDDELPCDCLHCLRDLYPDPAVSGSDIFTVEIIHGYCPDAPAFCQKLVPESYVCKLIAAPSFAQAIEDFKAMQ